MDVLVPVIVRSDRSGFEFLSSFYELTKDNDDTVISVNFYNTTFFSANLCAALGSVLHLLEERGKNVKFINLSKTVKGSLSKNLFLLNFGEEFTSDYYSTTIKYRRFQSDQEEDFQKYLERELLSQPDLPKMTPLLKNKISKSILEIFNNAFYHAGCNGIYSCGQYYPKLKKLDFTISDLGRTIKANVNKFLKEDKSASGAIEWAVEEGNTTKTGNIPGGLGLSLIREFLRLNRGKIQITSGNGYWEEKEGVILAENFASVFAGTIVNLGFNIDDSKSYAMASEIDPNTIF